MSTSNRLSTWWWVAAAVAFVAALFFLPDLVHTALAQVPELDQVDLVPTDGGAGEVVAAGAGRIVVRVLAILVAVALAVLFRMILRQAGTTLLYLAGFALIFAGERLWPDGGVHWPLTGLGLIAVLATLVLRIRALRTEKDALRIAAQRNALIWACVGTSSLVVYFLTTQTVVDAIGFDEDAEARWSETWTALMPVVWMVGTLPMIFLDRVLVQHPVRVPPRGAKLAIETGLATALGLCLLFPLNYLAAAHKWEYDAAYFRTTEAGSSTLALVRTLPEPVTAYLFFPAGSDVKEELLPYFEQLQRASDGLLDVQAVDQALVPDLSEKLKIRDNGYVALVRGEATEKFKIGTDLDRSRTKLKKLDETVQEHLLALAKGQRVAYLLTGHGEASAREKDDPLRKLNLFKQLLDAQNYKVENFGVAEGSADAVPDDATVVVVAAPEKPLLPEEERALIEYLDKGGRMLILYEPGGDRMEGLLGHLGVAVGSEPLAHPSAFIRQTRGLNDRVLLVTNRFGSHESVTTLSRNSTQLAVVVPTVAKVEKKGETSGKVTTIIRSLPDTFEDLNGNRQLDEGEPSKVFDIAVAVSGPEDGPDYRALVIGDVNLFSDPVLRYSQGNAVLAADGMRWLVGDEALAGETENEEDVRIQHTRDQDVAWFWGTIFAVPMLILIGGMVFIRIRRAK